MYILGDLNCNLLSQVDNRPTHRLKCKDKLVSRYFKSGNGVSSNPKEISEVFNLHFTEIGPKLASNIPRGPTSYNEYIERVDSTYYVGYFRRFQSTTDRLCFAQHPSEENLGHGCISTISFEYSKEVLASTSSCLLLVRHPFQRPR